MRKKFCTKSNNEIKFRKRLYRGRCFFWTHFVFCLLIRYARAYLSEQLLANWIVYRENLMKIFQLKARWRKHVLYVSVVCI